MQHHSKIAVMALIWLFTVTSGIAKAPYHYTLKNGLEIFVKIDNRTPSVVSQIWYKVGSSYETLGITGISHTLEHMMFQGTKTYPPGKLNQLIASHGGIQNAMTSSDFTMYYQELPAKYLALSFKLEADRMQNLVLNPMRFQKEMQVIQEERRLRIDNNPLATTLERFLATANLASNYNHPVIGWMNDIKHLTITDLTTWYNNYYAPNNAIIVVVGDVKPKHVLQLAKKYFGEILAQKPKTIKPHPQLIKLGKRELTIHLPTKLTLLLIGFNVPSINTAKQAWKPYALTIIASILSKGKSSRFKKFLIRKQKIASEAYADYNPFSRLPTLFMLVGMPTPKKTITDLQHALWQQIKALQTKLVNKDELQRIKTQLIADKTFMQDSLFMQAFVIGKLESVGLSWHIYQNFIPMLNKITPKQIQLVSREFLIPNNSTTAILKPLPKNKVIAYAE